MEKESAYIVTKAAMKRLEKEVKKLHGRNDSSYGDMIHIILNEYERLKKERK